MIAYSVDGVQYVAITTGGGGPLDGGLATLAPEFATSVSGTTLWMFRLANTGAANGGTAHERPAVTLTLSRHLPL
jgi:hypothetical protein